jgi:hypothetical protein
MGQIRTAIVEDRYVGVVARPRVHRWAKPDMRGPRFPTFVRSFMTTMFPDAQYPAWAVAALATVNIQL